MFTFIVQLMDFIQLRDVQLFLVFFISTWLIYLIKLIRSRIFKPPLTQANDYGVSVIIPVVDEKPEIWKQVLTDLKESCQNLKHEIIIISNGPAGVANGEQAREMGLEVIHLPESDKRAAIAEGAKRARYEISVILDSDTRVLPDSIRILSETFTSKDIGGVTPLHKISNREIFSRRISDWLEDLRFNIVVRGQAVSGAVSCLPGRLFAIRTDLLKSAAPEILEERFFGVRCLNGDDRSLTSWLLKNGYKTLFQPASVVYTEAPNTLFEFAQQRLRWARGSLRGTIMGIGWLFRYPYTAFTLFATILIRWIFLVVIIQAIFVWSHILPRNHYIWSVYPDLYTTNIIIAGVLLGYFFSGLLRQLFHLIRFPHDLPYLPLFLLVTTFVLTPVNWFGDLTCWRSDWLTRKV